MLRYEAIRATINNKEVCRECVDEMIYKAVKDGCIDAFEQALLVIYAGEKLTWRTNNTTDSWL